MGVAVDYGEDGVTELGATVPAGEQADVLAEPLNDAVFLDGVPTGEGESELCGGLQSDLGQASMRGVHQPASTVGPASSGNVASHTARTCVGSHRVGQIWARVSASSQRCSCAGVLAWFRIYRRWSW